MYRNVLQFDIVDPMNLNDGERMLAIMTSVIIRKDHHHDYSLLALIVVKSGQSC